MGAMCKLAMLPPAKGHRQSQEIWKRQEDPPLEPSEAMVVSDPSFRPPVPRTRRKYLNGAESQIHGDMLREPTSPKILSPLQCGAPALPTSLRNQSLPSPERCHLKLPSCLRSFPASLLLRWG